MSKISVLIVEDHATTRIGLRVELSQEPDIDVVDVASNVEEGLHKCAALHPDVILLDLHLPDSAGPKTLLAKFLPMGQVVVFSAEGSRAVIGRILELGAAGFVSKADTTAQLLKAIRAAATTHGKIGTPNQGGPVYQQEIDSAIQVYQEWLGKIVDERFRVLDVLGIGGYSVVYKAQDLETKSLVALKMIHQHLATRSDTVARFQREISTSRGLHHPNIAPIYGAGATENGQPYLAMEFLVGCTLSDEIEARGKLAPPRTVALAQQICAGLHHAHCSGVVHRDVKPANVFLTEGDAVKILDFGLVKVMDKGKHVATLTETGATIGTPSYMSPEQCHGYDLDARSDVYALGCMLYEMLCGERPFDGESYVILMHKHIGERPNYVPLEASGVPRPIIAVIDKALQKDRNDRWRSAEELGQQLVAAIDQKQNKLGSLFKLMP